MQVVVFQNSTWIRGKPVDATGFICHWKYALSVGIDNNAWIEWFRRAFYLLPPCVLANHPKYLAIRGFIPVSISISSASSGLIQYRSPQQRARKRQPEMISKM